MFTNVKTKPINHVEWLGREGLAAFLATTFGRRDFVWNDVGNDTYHRFDIGADERLDDYDRKTYEQAKGKGFCEDYGMRAVLLGLIEDGHIPAGDYLLHVSW